MTNHKTLVLTVVAMPAIHAIRAIHAMPVFSSL